MQLGLIGLGKMGANMAAIGGPQAKPAAIAYRAPASAARHVVTGLAPGGRYAASATKDGALCRVAIAPGDSTAASAAGVLALGVRDCVIAP